MKTFLIVYQALDSSGRIIKEGKVKAKKKMSEFEASASFENHLKKTLNGFSKLIVISCREYTIFDEMLDMVKNWE